MRAAELRTLATSEPDESAGWWWTVYVVSSCAGALAATLTLDSSFSLGASLITATLSTLVMCAAFWVRSVFGHELTGLRSRTLAGTGLVLLLAAAVLPGPAALVAAVLYPVLMVGLQLPGAILATGLLVDLLPLTRVSVTSDHTSQVLTVTAVYTVPGLISAFAIYVAVINSRRGHVRLTRVIGELAESRRSVARLSRQAGMMAERERLAHEIHDTLAQGFVSIVTLSQAIETELIDAPKDAARHLGLVTETARESLKEARAMVEELTPAAMGNLCLTGAIQRLGERLTHETGIDVEVMAELDLPPLSTSVEVVLLRVTQEAIANVRKHSRARQVLVRLARSPLGIRLTVTDDGVGLPDNHTEGYGLRGIRTRVEQIGGTVAVSASQDAGVTVDIELAS